VGSTSPAVVADIQKGKWVRRTEGKIPVRVSYTVRKRGKTPYEVTRTHWVLPDKALSGDHEIDFERIVEEKVELPSPDNLNRLHAHYGAEDPHPVAKVHKNYEIQSEHRDEEEKYSRNYHKYMQEVDSWERKKQGKKRKLQQEKERIEHKKKAKPEEKAQLKDLIKKINKLNQQIERRHVAEEIPWIDKYNVVVDVDRKIRFRGIPTQAAAYSLSKSKNEIYLFSDPIGTYYLYSKNMGLERYDKSSQAYNRLEQIFETKSLWGEILFKSQELERKILIYKTHRLISEMSEHTPFQGLPVQEVKNEFKMFSKFQSGNDYVTLEGDDNQYKVTQNGVIETVTEDLQEALTKYYSSVSRIIEAQSEDKDMGLELFGEHCLQTARETRQMMSALSTAEKAEFLNQLDFSELEFPFNENWVAKNAPQADVFGIVPVREEMGVGAAEGGKKPSRGDLTEEDYEEDEKDEECQEPIEEGKAQGPGIGGIGPAIVSKDAQYQRIPARDEESKFSEEVDKPYKVNRTYSQNLKVPENKVIEEP
jgi:hypothetical protein